MDRGGSINQAITQKEYDAMNRLIKVVDGEGVIAEELKYNLDHQQIESGTYLGNSGDVGARVTTKFEYDKSGNRTRTIDGEGHISATLYDGLGRVVSQSDGNGNGRACEFDKAAGKIGVVTNALGEKTRYSYDVMGNLISQTDGNGNTATWEYNVRNLPLRRIDAGGYKEEEGKRQYDPKKTESYTYYGDGSLKTTLDRNGVTTTTQWNVLGQEIKKEAGGLKVNNQYDGNGNKTVMNDSTGKTARVYDELGRCILKSVPKVGTSLFTYDTTVNEGGADYLADVFTDPTGKETKTIYDKAGRTKWVIDPNGGKTTFEYYANGLKKKITYPGGATEEYTYLKDGTLKELKNTYGGKTDTYTYTYDAAGNQLTKTEPQGNTTYTYDRLNRLVKVVEPYHGGTRTTDYGYDKAGNRTQQVANVQGATDSKENGIKATHYEYNEQNRLISTTEETVGDGNSKDVTEYNYDNNGNLLYRRKSQLKKIDVLNPPTPHFSAFVMGQTTVAENPLVGWIGANKYNAFNQLTESTNGGAKVISIYDGEGLRTGKSVSSKTTHTLYVDGNPVLYTDSDGKETGRTVYGAGTALIQNGQACMYNGHGDVVALIDGGTVKAEFTYDAFGVPTKSTGTSPIRYGGYEYDDETGYYYLKARMYDPVTARFLQEDTYRGDMSDPLSLNLYTYCSNNPVVYWDPTGHWQSSDKNLKESARVSISKLTDAYYRASSDKERAAIHSAAESIRNNSANQGGGGGSTGAKYDSVVSSSGRSYITASEWNSISTTKSSSDVKAISTVASKASQDGKISAKELSGIVSASGLYRSSTGDAKPLFGPTIPPKKQDVGVAYYGQAAPKNAPTVSNIVENRDGSVSIMIDGRKFTYRTKEGMTQSGRLMFEGEMMVAGDGAGNAVLKVGGKVVGVVRDAKILDKAWDAISGIGRRTEDALGALCFTAETLILAKDGYKQIQNVKIGDQVFAENPQTGERGLKKVKQVFINEARTLVHVFAHGEETKTTPSHPFFVVGIGWVKASKLQKGDLLKLANGKTARVDDVSVEALDAPVKVYNFEVEDWHTYFVSGAGVLVHNQCFQGSPGWSTVAEEKSVTRAFETMTPKQQKIYEETIEKLAKGDTRGLHVHPVDGKLSADLKGFQNGRGDVRIYYTEKNGVIHIDKIDFAHLKGKK